MHYFSKYKCSSLINIFIFINISSWPIVTFLTSIPARKEARAIPRRPTRRQVTFLESCVYRGEGWGGISRDIGFTITAFKAIREMFNWMCCDLNEGEEVT